ncbi:MAG: GNAT family N-acetyltransferase [Prevotellaceae bacterium]|nr:GNAT family N-acetyltransferase [Prevotellaceae bacterium]
MIRKVELTDAGAIAAIYNGYILNSVATFEIETLTEEDMRKRISDISARFFYFVCEIDGEIAGYCYAHPWKERAAYQWTLETTVYVAPSHTRQGVGIGLMERLVDECRQRGYHALIACITEGNEASCKLHERLGFKQVSCFEKVGVKFGKRLDVVDYELLL